MPIQRRSVSNFSDSISASVASRDNTIDTEIGPVKDLFITPFAEVIKTVHDNTVYLSQLQSLKYAERFNPEDLDDLVFNEGIVRWRGSPSVVTLTFSRTSPPTSDIVVPINFPLATIEDARSGTSVQFRTIETKTMYYASASGYANNDTGRWEISVAAASIGSGPQTEVGANTVTVFKRNFPEFEAVTNKAPAVGGVALESNAKLSARYLLQIRGNQEATPKGLQLFSMDNFSNVQDSYVAYGNNPDLTRQDRDAGAVDNWIKSNSPLTETYFIIFPGVAEIISVPNQPLVDVSKVASNGITFIKGTDYALVTSSGVYAYSVQAYSGIKFLSTATTPLPAVGDTLEIEYQYNASIKLVDSLYAQPEYYVMGSNVLFRWAQPLPVQLEATLKVKAGNPVNVLSSVRERVYKYINSLKLGESLEEFDIDAQVATIFGVDNFTYSQLSLKGGSGIGDIPAQASQYITINQADLLISLTS